MEKKDDKKKKIITIVISILIIIILIMAVSYAFFRTQLSGTDQVVKVGTLDLVLDETSEGISLDNAIGISDSEGLSLEGSTFKLINNGSKAVDYIIYLDDNTISDTDTRIDDKFLKYNLVKNGESSGAKLLTSIGSNPNRVLDSGTIEGKETNEYSLNLWITDEVDGNYSGQVFSGKLRVEVSQEKDKSVASVLLRNLPEENINTTDEEQTFITGEDPNNYIWYSGKLWRAVSIDPSDNSVKLVTQWNITAIPYNSSDNTDFEGSYMQEWLNDTSVDGFLGNLRDPEKFIVTDAVWDATMDDRELGSITRPNGTTVVTNAVGLLNMYEYQSSYNGTTYRSGYLNNGLDWWTLTPYSSSYVRNVYYNGNADNNNPTFAYGVRPSINLKSNVKIVDGDGTVDNPYRLNGDNDTDLSGTLLSTRYSGEYIRFGNDENNLYRIVSHENGVGTKIVSAEPLKSSGNFVTSAFGSNITFSNSNTIGTFLNGDYLTSYVDSAYSNMIEDSTTWYLGTVGDGVSYKLAKYTDTNMSSTTSNTTNAKVGLLRLGELMSGQFERYAVKGGSSSTGLTKSYWTLTPYSSSYVRNINYYGSANNLYNPTDAGGVRPSINLKSNVEITSGTGVKSDPFVLTLGS